jgi:hypothetical protein
MAGNHFLGIKNLVNSHLRMKVRPQVADKVLPWVHTTISNSKMTNTGNSFRGKGYSIIKII